MLDFNLKLETELIFGINKQLEIAKVVKKYGKKRLIILYGESFALRSGLLSQVTEELDKEEIDYVLYGGIIPNPEVKFVRESRQIAREHNIDLILAIGGGSVIDVAKSLAVSYSYDGNPLDFSTYTAKPQEAIDIGVILTHASAGSEMSPSCVISDKAHHFKQGFRSDLVRPLFSICNPELTYSVSKYQTAVGIVDSFMHSLERYFCESAAIELADEFALGIFKTLKACAEALIVDPYDEVARANLMLASTFSHNDVTGMGKKTSMPAHALEHALSALYPSVIHGHGLAIIYPAWLTFYLPYIENKLDRIAQEVFHVNKGNVTQNAQAAIDGFKDLFTRLGLTLTLSSVGVRKEDITAIADIVTNKGTKTVYHYSHNLGKNDIISIYESCY